MSPDAEPLPGFGRENMGELSSYFTELATQEAMATFPDFIGNTCKFFNHIQIILGPF